MLTYQTTDIAIAAYLKVRGFHLANAGLQKDERGRAKKGAHYYVFNDPEGKAHSIAVAFVNSPESEYDAALRSLKKLIYASKSIRQGELRVRGKPGA